MWGWLLHSFPRVTNYNYLRQGRKIVTAGICLSVCLLAKQLEKLGTDCNEMFRKCWLWGFSIYVCCFIESDVFSNSKHFYKSYNNSHWCLLWAELNWTDFSGLILDRPTLVTFTVLSLLIEQKGLYTQILWRKPKQICILSQVDVASSSCKSI